jgi:hypothetical protein
MTINHGPVSFELDRPAANCVMAAGTRATCHPEAGEVSAHAASRAAMLKRAAQTLSRRCSFPWLNQRLCWPLRLVALVNDLDTAAHNSRLRAQVQTE